MPITPDPVVINPPATLLIPCTDPILVSNGNPELILANKRAYKLAYENCRDRVRSYIDWHQKRGVPIPRT